MLVERGIQVMNFEVVSDACDMVRLRCAVSELILVLMVEAIA